MAIYNRAKVVTATIGQGTLTLGAAASNAFCTFAQAGVPDGATVTYVIEEGLDFEIGRGVYTLSGTTLTRATVLLSKIGGTAGTTKMTLAGNATVQISAVAEEIVLSNRQVVSGAGLTGGGDFSADRTLAVGAGTGITVNADDVAIAPAYQAVGKQSIWVPAWAMRPIIAGQPSFGNLDTAGAQQWPFLSFDPSTNEFASFLIGMPKGWDEGQITFTPVWSHPATTTNFGVLWALRALARSNGDALTFTWSGASGLSIDTGGTTDTLYRGPESSLFTIDGTPAELDVVNFQVFRYPPDASDTLAVDARLHGIHVNFTLNAANDA